ncbi:MAG: hypothetical protein NUV77_13460 [Thermoguttaceae bacterium]|jgi:hypothetical protein|nr:hypothetical protein [Thermoguttaceae bacterium]
MASVGAALLLAGVEPARGQSPGSLGGPSWQPHAPETVRAQAMAWLEGRKVDAAVQSKAAAIWNAKPTPAGGAEVLDRLVRTFALADENVAKLVEFCAKPRAAAAPPAQPWLTAAGTPPLVASNVRLWYARWLIHEALYDEAAEQLQGLQPQQVVDPASLLFCQAVVHYRLLNRDAGMEALAALLEGADHGPSRYVALARLMEADLKDLQEDSLDHIARRMEDIERRLDLGRAGKKVRSIEDGVIESLDKLIKQLEDQQQESQSAGASNLQPSRPAQDSQIISGKGKGEVDRKRIGSQSGWGNLPPRDREEALQQIGRDFPSHYRDVIEQYFRRLATEGSE